jgi:transposase-like protein
MSVECQEQRKKIMANQTSSKQNGRVPMNAPDPEVVPQAKRRQFSAAYKRQIVAEADACSKPGEIGALLRREGLYSSHLSNWRRQMVAGTLGKQQRGRPAEPLAAENERLRQENERLRRELEKTQLIVEAQKKLAQVLDLMGHDEVERNEPA